MAQTREMTKYKAAQMTNMGSPAPTLPNNSSLSHGGELESQSALRPLTSKIMTGSITEIRTDDAMVRNVHKNLRSLAMKDSSTTIPHPRSPAKSIELNNRLKSAMAFDQRMSSASALKARHLPSATTNAESLQKRKLSPILPSR